MTFFLPRIFTTKELFMNYSLGIIKRNFQILPFNYPDINKKWNNDTKRSEEPNGTYNLGTYSLNVQSNYIALVKGIGTIDDIYSNKLHGLWENLRFYSRQFVELSFIVVEKGTANITDLLYKVKLYLYLGLISLIFIYSSACKLSINSSINFVLHQQ
jgi:hypothetical protein